MYFNDGIQGDLLNNYEHDFISEFIRLGNPWTSHVCFGDQLKYFIPHPPLKPWGLQVVGQLCTKISSIRFRSAAFLPRVI